LKEAARAEIDGDTNTVYLQLKRGTAGSTATNATNHQIRYGWLEGDSSIFTQWGEASEQAIEVFLNLHLTPYGERATTISLANEMFNSPHFLETSAVANLAAGWTTVDGAETLSLATNRWLIGGQCQKFATDNASNMGIRCDSVACAAATDVVGYVWLQTDNTDQISIVLRDDQAVIETKIFTYQDGGAVSDKTATGYAGETWWRVSLSGTTDGAASTYWLEVRRVIGDATQVTQCWVDGAYLAQQSTVPDAWMSARNIDNRNDYATTSQATENYLNYIDVWGVPGDAMADVNYQIKSKEPGTEGGGGPNVFYLSRVFDGTYLAAEQDHWIESSEFDAEGGANWTQVATDTGGSFERFTAAGGASVGSITWNFDGENARKLSTTRRFLMARLRSSDVAVATVFMTVRTLYGLAGGTNVEVIHDAVTLNTNDNWELVELGLINFANLFSITPPDTSNPRMQIVLRTNAIGAAETFDVDNLMLHYVDHDGYYISDSGSILDEETSYFYSKDNKVANESAGIEGYGLGTIPRLKSGNVSNRILMQYTTAASKQYGYDGELEITLVITPRTRHLMGVL
jgi:hypothetical protein